MRTFLFQRPCSLSSLIWGETSAEVGKVYCAIRYFAGRKSIVDFQAASE